MKKVMLLLMVVLMMAAGCISFAPTSSSKLPTAYIDSISPADASPGDTVTFTGHGTDQDGTVVGYSWRSSLDGDLSTIASFETSSLSAGEHTIYFKVQDNNGNWSDEVRSSVTIAGSAAATPIIRSFEASPADITAGGSSTLSWSVSNATTVSIDQGIGDVALTGSMAVSPAITTTYILTATNATGSATARTQVLVSGSPSPGGLPSISYFVPNPPMINSGDSSTLSWSVSGATTVEINRGIGNVNPVDSVSVSPGTTTSYTLTATNAFGWASATTQVTIIGGTGDVTPPSVPVLASPADGAILPQPGAPWIFNWGNSSDPESGINQYQIRVRRTGAASPKIDEKVTASNYSKILSAAVPASNCADWIWKVRAQNNEGLWSDWSTTRGFDVELPAGPPVEHTVTLFSLSGEDGHVKQGGGTSSYPNVGDNSAGGALQAFLSFDMSGIPFGSTIKSVSLDLSTGDELGDPFAGLGWMRVYNDLYGSLDSGDFTPGFPTGAIFTYASRPVAPFSSSGLTSAVQGRVGALVPRFQVRLQFQTYTDVDGQVDCLRLGSGNPKLVITYEE